MKKIMKFNKIIIAFAALGLLTSCSSRNTLFSDEVNAVESTNWHVHDVQVIVPDSLTTSEVNILRPNVDIVWHGEPRGDRRQQVGTILHDALVVSAESLIPENLHRPVVIEATLIQFHSLTPRARSLVGGIHKVKFSIQVVDQKTGELLAGPTVIEADEFAFGNWKAVRADADGQTMKVRISNRIAEVVSAWLGLAAAENAVEQGRIYGIGR